MNPPSKVWRFINIYGKVEFGENVSIGCFCDIGGNYRGVKIGNNVKIQAHCFIPDGTTIEDNVFIGPGVVFTNDKNPPSGKENWKETLVKRGAVIGANATILPGLTIHENARIGAGAVVTKDVSPNATVCGNPARELT